MKLIKFTAWICVICALVYGGFFAYEKIEKTIYPMKYSNLIEHFSDEYGIDKSLVYAVVKCESGFDPNAVSNKDAVGLMQLTPVTYEWVCSKYKETSTNADDLFEPNKNIEAGCRLLKLHLTEFSSVRTVLAAYHAGRGIVNEWLKNKNYSDDGINLKQIPYNETANYVDKVIKTREKYKTIYNII